MVDQNTRKRGGMRKIPASFTRKGYEYRQISRTGDIAIYEQASDTTKWYDVVVITKHKESKRIIQGKERTFQATEVYPSDSQWGAMGWTYYTLQNAQVKANELKIALSTRRRHLKSSQIPEGYQD
jgi:hypothetical protein